MSVIVELKNIKKIFYTEEIETHALSNICFTINKGEYISISGPSGCGKSTLLSIMGLLDKASEGEYKINGIEVSTMNTKEQAAIRNQNIGFIFQSFNLISDLTVAENVMLPLTYRKGMSKSEMNRITQEALHKVDMTHRSQHFPTQLSGGQQQRIAVARAIVGNPTLVLADEPTGNLDSKNADAVMELLDQLHQMGSTICIVTHDPRLANRAKRKIEIFDGLIVDDHQLHSSSSSV